MDIPRHPKSSKYLVSRCLEPLKAEPQEMFGGSNTSSIGVWMSRACSQDVCFLGSVHRSATRTQIASEKVLKLYKSIVKKNLW